VRRALRALGGFMAWIAVGVFALVAFLLLRTPAGPLRSWPDLESHLGTGRPVVVEVYSNG